VNRVTCLFAIILLTLVACDTETQHPGEQALVPSPSAGDAGVTQEQIITTAHLRGQLHDMENISNYATELKINDGSESTTIVAYVPHEDGRKAMSIFNMEYGNLNHPDFQTGAAYSFAYIGGSNETDVEVRIIGCLVTAGDDEDLPTIYFDQVADHVDVWIDSLPGGEMKRINYIATWNDGYHLGNYTGYFDVINY